MRPTPIISHKVTFYFVKGYEEFYKGKRNHIGYLREASINKLLKGCVIPSEVSYITMKDILNPSITDLGIISSDLNIIFIPTVTSILKILVHSDFIFLFVSFPPSSGACTGDRTYYSFIKRIRANLTKAAPFDIIYRRSRPYSRNKYRKGTLVKSIDLACCLDVVDPRMFRIYYDIVKHATISSRTLKANMLKLLRLKYKLFYRYATKKQFLDRSKEFTFDGVRYADVDTI